MESFDAFRYIGYMRSRWRWIAASCVTAVAVAFAASLAMTRLYTATARIVIEPPAGTDLRAAVAVSPIYLESLRTYEQFAGGDSLFQKAIDKFGLRKTLGARPIESLKKQVLKVGLLRNTRILEISATLPDPRQAQALAQFVAESTVEISRGLTGEGDRDLLQGMERQQRELRERLRENETAWNELLAREPVNTLQSENENSALLRSNIEQEISRAEVELAEPGRRGDDQADTRARLQQMRKQLETLNSQAVEREKLLSVRVSHRDRLDVERKALEGQLNGVETQLREARGGAAFRGERLKIIDPGIVPERPSAPNLPLNVAAAFLLGLVLPLLWLTLQMGFQEQRAAERRSGFQAYAKARDE
jgi:capsular polysaccharide biosynthesis protein